MKTEDLKTWGLTKEQIKGIYELNGKDVNAEKLKTSRAKKEIEELQIELEKARESLRKFMGANIEGFKKQIEFLKEKVDIQKKDYEKAIQEIEFNYWLNEKLNEIKVKSIKALKVELGKSLEEVKESNNRGEALAILLENKKEEIAYLIPSEEPIKNPVQEIGAKGIEDGKVKNILYTSMGLFEK